MRVTALLIAALSMSGSAIAADNCRRVYENAVRNVSVDTDDSTSLISIFDEHCENNGSVRSSTTEVKADVVIKKVPVKFWGSHQGSRERFQNFCKTYQAERFSQENQSRYRNEVVTRALELFNQCEALSIQGVQIAHYENVSDVVVDFSMRRGIDFEIQGVSTVNAQCGVVTGDAPRRVLNKETSFKPPANTNFGMICTRTERQDRDKIVYDPATVTIASNFGPYTISLWKEEVWGPPLASVHAREFSKITDENKSKTKEVETLKSELSAMENRMNNANIKTYLFHIGEHARPSAGGHYVCGTSVTSVRDRICGKDVKFVVSDFRTAHGGDQCGYAYLAMGCLSYPP